MALVKCKECGQQISTDAKACPSCGKKRTSCVTLGCAAILVLCLVGFIASLVVVHDGGTPGTKPSATTPPVPVPGTQWNYSQIEDKMGKGTSYFAMVTSTNALDFDFPYSGPQHATLTLRTHPRHGKDLILRIERGQFLCHSFDDCSVLVRFDDGQAQKYSASPPADNSTEQIFIQNYSRFVGNMLKAKRVRISTKVYHEGEPVMEFDVSDFDASRYQPSK
jgi:hypothetical protein